MTFQRYCFTGFQLECFWRLDTFAASDYEKIIKSDSCFLRGWLQS